MRIKRRSIFNKILNLFYLKEYIYKTNLKEQITEEFHPALSFKMLTKDNIDSYVSSLGTHLDKKGIKEMSKFINADHIKCFIIIFNEQIGGYCHINNLEIRESAVNYREPLEANSAYFFKDYIFENFRGNSLHKYSIYKRIEYCRKKGLEFAYTAIYKSNRISQKSYLRYGFQRTKHLVYLNLIVYKHLFMINKI